MRLLRQDRDLLDTVQLIITIATGGLALWLTYLQGELSRRIQKEGITQTYAEKILSHLNDLKMEPEQRGGFVIDVLDIITEANLNVSEQPYTDMERQQLIPLRLALATHDADLLALLELLDPENYAVDTLTAFKERTAKRVELGRAFLALRSATVPALVDTAFVNCPPAALRSQLVTRCMSMRSRSSVDCESPR